MTARPRTAVIAAAWARAEIDAPTFVNTAGVPLARSIKCLIDSLVIQPRVHRHLAAALLSEADADGLTASLEAARPQLEDASRWYLILRAQRRHRGISDGNPQELYFPRAFELAVTRGERGLDADTVCAEVLAEVHDDSQPGVDALAALLADEATRARVEERWASDWVAEPKPLDVDVVAAQLLAALCEGKDADRARAAVLDRDLGERIGRSLRQPDHPLGAILAQAGLPRPALRLAEDDPERPPSYLGQGHWPLDRTFEQRARAALRRQRDHGIPVSADDLVADEADRVSEPLGLVGADVRALFVLGVLVAAAFDPLGRDRVQPISRPRVVADLQARLRKEAYVLHLRRELGAGQAIHPGRERVVEELGEFWRPWLTRLWVRLHGRDVTASPGTDDAIELLTGITRSVILDHRQRIRGALEKVAG